jgi:hypothetical protein
MDPQQQNDDNLKVLKTLTGTNLYQICVSGRYKSFEGKHKFHSKKVYIETPSQTEIEAFVQKCCNSEHPYSLYDLDINTIDISILTLELNF